MYPKNDLPEKSISRKETAISYLTIAHLGGGHDYGVLTNIVVVEPEVLLSMLLPMPAIEHDYDPVSFTSHPHCSLRCALMLSSHFLLVPPSGRVPRGFPTKFPCTVLTLPSPAICHVHHILRSVNILITIGAGHEISHPFHSQSVHIIRKHFVFKYVYA
jgi:hypothetical protein